MSSPLSDHARLKRPRKGLVAMAPPRTPPGSGARLNLTPRIKVWFESESGFSFGFGLVEILQAVERVGSIKQAAEDLGRSYRHVWDRIKDAEKALGQSLVETQVGGLGTHRSELSEAARQLITDFLALRGRMIDIMDEERNRGPAS